MLHISNVIYQADAKQQNLIDEHVVGTRDLEPLHFYHRNYYESLCVMCSMCAFFEMQVGSYSGDTGRDRLHFRTHTLAKTSKHSQPPMAAAPARVRGRYVFLLLRSQFACICAAMMIESFTFSYLPMGMNNLLLILSSSFLTNE